MNFFKSKSDEDEPQKDTERKANSGNTAEAENETLATKSGEDHAKITMMKRGDYMIHVYLEQAKEMMIDADATVDPIVELSVLGEKKYSQPLNSISNTDVAVWNEHIFFEPKNVEQERLAEGIIEIKLMDKGFFKDALIGSYQFDMTQIYQMKDHALLHKYVALSNPKSENFGDVTGYLKLSITIAGGDDPKIPIEEDPNPDVEDILQ
jgi:hypothetical protein